MIQWEIPSTMLWKERAKTTNPVLRAALTCADVFWCSFSKSSTLLHISFIFILHLCDCLHSFPQQFHSSLASLFLQHFGVGEENDAELPQGQKWRRIHKSLSPQQEGEICYMFECESHHSIEKKYISYVSIPSSPSLTSGNQWQKQLAKRTPPPRLRRKERVTFFGFFFCFFINSGCVESILEKSYLGKKIKRDHL